MSTLWIFSVHLCQLPQKASTEVHSFLSIYVGVEQCSGAVVCCLRCWKATRFKSLKQHWKSWIISVASTQTTGSTHGTSRWRAPRCTRRRGGTCSTQTASHKVRISQGSRLDWGFVLEDFSLSIERLRKAAAQFLFLNGLRVRHHKLWSRPLRRQCPPSTRCRGMLPWWPPPPRRWTYKEELALCAYVLRLIQGVKQAEWETRWALTPRVLLLCRCCLARGGRCRIAARYSCCLTLVLGVTAVLRESTSTPRRVRHTHTHIYTVEQDIRKKVARVGSNPGI